VSVKLGKRIEIDESNFKLIDSLGTVEGSDRLCIGNESEDIETDATSLYNHLKNLEGANRVEALHIEWSSRLRDIMIIKAFPNLRFLHVWGHNIVSLAGLEWFEKGEYIDIDTGKNHKRVIDEISHVPIQRISLNYGKKEDYEAIGKCLSLNNLDINKGPSPDFYKWRNVPLEHLRFEGGKFTELSDVGCLKALKDIMVMRCRTFERFVGDNSSVRNLTIHGCKRFDILSLSSLQGLETVWIHSCAPEISLSDLPDHSTLRGILFNSCKVNVDVYDIARRMPRLEDITIPKLKKEQEQLLSQANPNIKFETAY